MIYTNLIQTLKTQTWTQAQEDLLLEPFSYLTSTPGKEIRSRLIDAFNVWLKVPEEDLEVVRRVVRMLHTGSLLMDDVEDDSQLRRGIPVAHKIYGIPQTINTANYVYFLAYQELFQFRRRKIAGRSRAGTGISLGAAGSSSIEGMDGKGKAKEDRSLKFPETIDGTMGRTGKQRDGKEEDVDLDGDENMDGERNGLNVDELGQEVFLDEIITEELLNLHRGQGLDLFWRDTLTCPTEEEYVQMVLGKTGGLFRIAVKLMMARSKSSVEYVPLVNLISILFQIRDDYMNLQSSGSYADNKGFAEDLTEGKFSFLVTHAVRKEMGNRELLNILQKRTDSQALKSHAVEIMRTRTKSFEYTRGVLKELEGQVYAEIERLGGNALLERIVRALEVRDEEGAREGDNIGRVRL